MTDYRSAKDLQAEVEELLGHEVEGVTVNHATGGIDIEGVTPGELDEVRQSVDPVEQSVATFRRGPPSDRGGRGDAGR